MGEEGRSEVSPTLAKAQAIWDASVIAAADAWRASHGKNILDSAGSSSAFTAHVWRAFADISDEVKAALNPDDSRLLSREFKQAVEAQL
jgi:hypothetical protein